MNKLIISTVALLFAATVNAQIRYTVKGKVAQGHPATRAVIGYEEGKIYKTDTVNIYQGRFEFTSVVPRPPLAQITLLVPSPAAGAGRNRRSSEEEDQGALKNIALFYPEGLMQVSFDTAGNASVTGGDKHQKAYEAYMAFALANSKKKDDQLPFDKVVLESIRKNPDAYISLDIMEMFAGVIQPATFEPMYLALSKRLRNTEKAKSWKKRLDQAKKFDVGQPSADFTINDTKGKPVSLSSFKGRYLLLDFWASWCGPCRAGHPELIDTYGKFKGEKFEILAVSLDDKKEAWLKAIKDDKLPWRQVSDLKGASSAVAKLYNVTQIPQNLLIDPKGMIVGRNLTGKSLEEKLSTLLN
jgi:peroxiredoxin